MADGPQVTSPPSYVPANLLEVFDELESDGDWTLTVSDRQDLDTGTFVEWSLEIGGFPCFDIPGNGNDNDNDNDNGSGTFDLVASINAPALAEIGETITQIDTASSAISAAIEEQSTTTREIAQSVQEAARGTDQVTESMNQVQTASNESGQASSQVLEAAKSVADQSVSMRERVNRFLTDIKAA